MKLGALRTDVAAFDDGVWQTVVKAPDGESDLRMKIRSQQSRAYLEAQAAEIKRLKEQSRTRDVSEADGVEIQRRIAHVLVTDWDGVDGDDGTPIPYTPSKCREILADPANTVILEIVQRIANDIKRFREVTLQDSKSES